MAVLLKTEEEQNPQVVLSPPLLAAADSGASSYAVEMGTAAQAVAISVAANDVARRYDQTTTEKALALAARMQQEHQATLSAEQVVHLGEEMNVDSVFILRALAAMEIGAATARHQTANEASLATGATRQTAYLLPPTRLRAALLVPFLFAVATFFVCLCTLNQGTFVMAWILGGAPLVALTMGATRRSKRLGLVSGFSTGFFLGTSTTIATMIMEGGVHSAELPAFLLWLFWFTVIGALLGLTAAVCREYLPRLFRRIERALLRRLPPLPEEPQR